MSYYREESVEEYRKALQAMPKAERRALTEGTWDCEWEPPKPIGLRSHGCVESKWVPTKGRFTSLESKDESWARYFGLGKIVTVPMELYDVRDFSGKLIGYSSQDPAKCQYPGIKIAVLEEKTVKQCWQESLATHSTPASRGVLKSIEVTTRVIGIDQERFVCWCVRIEDAEALARSNWFKCIGEDKLEKFCYKLLRRTYERNHR